MRSRRSFGKKQRCGGSGEGKMLIATQANSRKISRDHEMALHQVVE
jgi:hypothetical protein